MHLLKHAVRGNGSVHVAVDLACAQADAGHEVTLAAARGSYDDLLRKHGVRVVDLPEPTSKRSAVSSAWALWRLCRQTRPDVIHAHMMSSAVLAYPVAKTVGAVLVTTVHNSFDAHSTLMRLGKVVVAVSDAERRHLIERGFSARKTVFVLNGAASSPREALPLDDIGPLARPCVLSLSGIHGRKAVGDIVTAFALVAREFPQWHLNVVGWGPEQDILRQRVVDMGLVDRVHFLGSTMTPLPVLRSADIFASASLADPCPLTTTEARSAGCAIVATAVGGVPEVLEHGRAGQLVPPSDPSSMADAFRRLMSDESVLADWQSRALAGADYFAVSRVAADYERIYRAAL